MTKSVQATEKVKAEVQVVADRAKALVDMIAIDRGIAMQKLAVAQPALDAAEAALQVP